MVANITIQDIQEFLDEWNVEVLPNWRPIDSSRLRLGNLIRPEDTKKLSENDASKNPNGWSCPPNQLYALIRFLKPKIVFETGVQNGFTTELISGALEKNGSGVLYSFDTGIDESSHLTWDGLPGQFVREEFKHRWILTIGKSVDRIPDVINNLTGKKIDVFHHDSDHEKANIEQEVDLILPHMSEGGILCMHDRYNNEFRQEMTGLIKRIPRFINEGTEFSVWYVNKTNGD